MASMLSVVTQFGFNSSKDAKMDMEDMAYLTETWRDHVVSPEIKGEK